MIFQANPQPQLSGSKIEKIIWTKSWTIWWDSSYQYLWDEIYLFFDGYISGYGCLDSYNHLRSKVGFKWCNELECLGCVYNICSCWNFSHSENDPNNAAWNCLQNYLVNFSCSPIAPRWQPFIWYNRWDDLPFFTCDIAGDLCSLGLCSK